MASANNTTDYYANPWIIIYENPATYIFPVIFFIIFVVGLLGNGSLIYIIAKDKKLHNAPNLMIVSLAIGDLLLIIFCVPFMATIFTFIAWPYGLAICKLREFLRTLSMGVSILTLTALSAERYMAIAYPLTIHRSSHMRRTYMVTAGVWIVSIGMATIDGVGAHVKREDNGPIFCAVVGWRAFSESAHSLFQFIVLFAIPFVIIAVFYIMIGCLLWRSGSAIQNQNGCKNQQASKQLAGRKRVAAVVLAFVVIFFVCWLPRHVHLFLWYFTDGNFNLVWMYFKSIALVLQFVNSCVNPAALYILSDHFRMLFNRHLFCCCTRQSQQQNAPATHGEIKRTLPETPF